MLGFITYAQNFEDVMLWRALHGVGAGFYIDVGAAEPDEDSVTRAFYDHGWRGVNIEPSPSHFASLAAARPRDTNLCCLVGAAPGELELYNIPETGLSTIDRDIAERHAADGRAMARIELPVRTLADICAEFAPAEIHFVKIDVEGAEADVLRGADFVTYRPWIVLVEATKPMSQEENWQEWDPLLTDAGYQFIWFDGLNRFYLAAERADQLRHAFRTPPNVFDAWVRPRGSRELTILHRAREVQQAMDRLREEGGARAAAFDGELAAAREEARAGRLEATVARTEASAARHEAATLRVEIVTARDDAGAARTQAAASKVALEVARDDADAAAADAIGLRAALGTAQHEAGAARAAAAALQAMLQATRDDGLAAHAEIGRLEALRPTCEHAQATVAALLASRSWRITAPLRGASDLLSADPIRRERLRRVAGTGPGRSGAKGLARVGVYVAGRAVARGGRGGRALARIVGTALPGPYRWLYAHYRSYHEVAAITAAVRPPVAETPSAAHHQADRDGGGGASAEERTMLLRLHRRGGIA